METAIGDAVSDRGASRRGAPAGNYGPLLDDELEELLEEELLEEEPLEEELLDDELGDELEEPELELDDAEPGIVEDRGTALPGDVLGIGVGSVGVPVHPASPAAVASNVPPDKTSRNSRRRYELWSCRASPSRDSDDVADGFSSEAFDIP